MICVSLRYLRPSPGRTNACQYHSSFLRLSNINNFSILCLSNFFLPPFLKSQKGYPLLWWLVFAAVWLQRGRKCGYQPIRGQYPGHVITLSQSEPSEAENVGIRCQVVRAGPLCLKRPIQAGDQFADGKDPKIGVKLFNFIVGQQGEADR